MSVTFKRTIALTDDDEIIVDNALGMYVESILEFADNARADARRLKGAQREASLRLAAAFDASASRAQALRDRL